MTWILMGTLFFCPISFQEFELQKVPKSKHGDYEAHDDMKEIEALRQKVLELEMERDRVSIVLNFYIGIVSYFSVVLLT